MAEHIKNSPKMFSSICDSPMAEGGSVWNILGGYAIMFFWVEIYQILWW